MARKKKEPKVDVPVTVAPVEAEVVPPVKKRPRKKKAETIEEKNIQDNDIVITNILCDSIDPVTEPEVMVIATDPIKDSIIQASAHPYYLLFKGKVIYDSSSKGAIEFHTKYILIQSKKYPYSGLRIINK